jgi:hypothetical protein
MITAGLAVSAETRDPPQVSDAAAFPSSEDPPLLGHTPLFGHAPFFPDVQPPVDLSAGAAAPGDDREHDRKRYRAFCRLLVEGSRVKAACHNPYPAGDRLQLHIECDRWWDIDADGVPEVLEPAGYVQLSGRCWKEIRKAWVSHQPMP